MKILVIRCLNSFQLKRSISRLGLNVSNTSSSLSMFSQKQCLKITKCSSLVKNVKRFQSSEVTGEPKKAVPKKQQINVIMICYFYCHNFPKINNLLPGIFV